MTKPTTPSREDVRQAKIGEAFLGAAMDDGTGDWYALSFADETGFLGGAYVRGSSGERAWARSHQLGINPGGEVQIMGPLPSETLDANVPEQNRERLLTREEWA